MSEKPTDPTDEVDPLQSLHAEIQKQAARIALLRNPDSKALTAEMAGTVLAIVSDVVIALTQVRDGHDEVLIDLDDRITAMEDDESKLTSEDADKLSALVGTVRHLVAVIRPPGSSQTAETEQALVMAEQLATECEEIIDDARMDDDDEDEDPAPAVPQLGNGRA